MKIILTLTLLTLALGAYAGGKRSKKRRVATKELFSTLESKSNCRPHLNKLEEQVRGVVEQKIETGINGSQPLFKLGDYNFNCTEVLIQIRRKWQRNYFVRDENCSVQARVFCKLRSYADKVLMSQANLCQQDPSIPNCFDRQTVQELSQVFPASIRYEYK